MFDKPDAAALVAEVRRALEEGLVAGFAQKVAANALGIAHRELTDGPQMMASELARLTDLVDHPGDVKSGNHSVVAAIRKDSQLITEEIIAHLIQTTIEKIAIDQPSYPAYRNWRNRVGETEISD